MGYWVDRRNHRNHEWQLWDEAGFKAEYVNHALLMDIRDELQKLNAVFACQNFLDVPNLLRRIDENTRKPKRKVAKK